MTIARSDAIEGLAQTGDGCAIAYRIEGAAEAPALLLSNSLGTTMEMWAPQMPTLLRSFRVIRYDSRGHGRSQAPVGAYSMDRLGRDVLELLDTLALRRVHFCGLSKGGMVGQWLGIRAPERIDRLILANTSAYMGPPASWDARIATVMEKGTDAISGAVVERWFTPRFQTEEASAVAAVRDMILATDDGGYAGCCAAIRDMDMRRLLGLIASPTLVIGGSEDPATPPEHSDLLATTIPDATLAMLKAAHLSNVELPNAFTANMLAHLTA